jgi:hypothetical protein
MRYFVCVVDFCRRKKTMNSYAAYEYVDGEGKGGRSKCNSNACNVI